MGSWRAEPAVSRARCARGNRAGSRRQPSGMANGRRAASAEKLIDLPLEEARAAKWRRVQQQHGPAFIGHPLEKLDEELLDAMSYAEEGALRGFPMVGMVEDLWYPHEGIEANRGAANAIQRGVRGGNPCTASGARPPSTQILAPAVRIGWGCGPGSSL